MLHNYWILGICLIIIGTCDSSTITTEQEEKNTSYTILELEDSLVSSSSDLFVKATILNQGLDSLSLSSTEIMNPIVAILVQNELGDTMAPIPPTMPQETTPILIPPQQAYVTLYDLNIFMPSLPKGRYSISMKTMPSNTIFCTITNN